MELLYPIALVFHVIGVILGIGSATIVDYLHLISLRRSSLEKGIVKIYPYMSRFINLALVIIYTSGIVLVSQKPELIQSPLFLVKVALVFIVTINGVYLQRKITPQLDRCVIKGTKYCTKDVLYGSVIGGSVSIVTWYSILILALTKDLGYSLNHFLIAYVGVLILMLFVSYSIEIRAIRWRK